MGFVCRHTVPHAAASAFAAAVTLGGLALTVQALEPRSIVHGGLERSYLLKLPHGLDRGQPTPIVFVFHGGGGDGRSMLRLTRFDAIAERERFVAVFPDGYERNWNDGRARSVSKAHAENIDDVGFVDAMIEAIAAEQAIDRRRMYATGMSNGAIFSHFLAAQRADRIAAIAPVVGGIGVPFAARFAPSAPVGVVIFQGTDDPLTPYAGGGIANGRRGEIIGTEEAARRWARVAGCSGSPHTESLPDLDPQDGCTAERISWSGCQSGTAVVLYRLRGAGHTWPGGPQYLLRRMIGDVCRDLDASRTIWEFFKAHTKP